MYQRVGSPAYKNNLDNTIKLMELAGNPENKFKSIHIAGTNGKGSTSAMICSILQESNLKVGLYTSPHLVDFRERIKINGKVVPENYVISFIEEHKENIELLKPSFFEISVAMAFSWFAEQKVDIAVIETGMGGRLDSTNVIIPILSVITNIGYDHTLFLGDTKSKIANEKAGIIKNNVPIIIGEYDNETFTIFKKHAKEKNNKITFADKNYIFRPNHSEQLTLKGDIFKNNKLFYENIECPLNGIYQQKNILTAIAATEYLKEYISKQQIIDGLKNVVNNTRIRGRWEKINNCPQVICDVGHNLEGFAYTFKQLLNTKHQNLHMVFGTNNDKNLDELFPILPKSATYYFCRADVPRALEYEILLETANKYKINGKGYGSVAEAYQAALKSADDEDLIFVGGSTFVVGEVLASI